MPTHISLQFPAEMNTSGSKTETTFVLFHANYDYSSRLSINNDLVLCKGLHEIVMTSTFFLPEHMICKLIQLEVCIA